MRDGLRLMLAAITPRQWTGLVAALNLAAEVAKIEAELGISLAADEGMRFRHRDLLYRLITPAVAAFDAEPLMRQLDLRGVCWERYRTLQEAIRQDKRLVADNPLFEQATHPGGHTYPTPRGLARSGDTLHTPVGIAPSLGQHTEMVLAEHLGLASAMISDLFDRNVVAGPR
jgi:2-methylfumaryl-CoA isomerase